MERISTDDNCTLATTGKSTRCLNLGSYNYLGFADDWKETCRDDVTQSVDEWPISMTSSRQAFGTTKLHVELEELVARFLGKESAVVFPMGYGTNSTGIPTLMGAGSLIISDSLNHTSIINGSRSSVAQIRVFKHNNTQHLEEILREGLSACPFLFLNFILNFIICSDHQRPAQTPPPVDQDHGDGGGHLLDGGRHLPAQGDRAHRQEVQGLYLR
jgi:7-keto-8-aminopelargonate synthetase-like enzyme